MEENNKSAEVANVYSPDLDNVVWTMDGMNFGLAVKPFGINFVNSALAKAFKDAEADRPAIPVDILADGTEEKINTPQYKKDLLAFEVGVRNSVADKMTAIMVQSCVSEVLIKGGDGFLIFDWKAAAKQYRKENKSLSELVDFPADDLELVIDYIVIKTQSQKDGLIDMCFNGETTAQRRESFRNSQDDRRDDDAPGGLPAD